MVENAMKNRRKSFFSGVLLLTFSTILVKLIGLIYKIPMFSILGAEGMGYFNSAYEIYALFCVIATAGLPVALSVLLADALASGREGSVARIFRVAFAVFVSVGLLGTLLMVCFASRFCQMMQSAPAKPCILSIAPTVFFVCLSSAYRGFFQGFGKMRQTAVSQVLEALGKLVFGLLLAGYAASKGYDVPTVAAFAGWGLTIGTAVSTAYLHLAMKQFRARQASVENVRPRESGAETYRIGKQLFSLAVPMTLGASLVSLTKLIDMTMILRRLQSIGYSAAEANQAYGSYTTLALSVFGLLPSLINAVALPLVPSLSSAIATGDTRRQAQLCALCYHLTAMLAIPASLGLTVFARPVLELLFPAEAQAVQLAAPLLSGLGISVFLSCMITATNSVLHAYQSVKRPILSMLAGAALKIAIAYLLIGNASVGLSGAPVSTFVCNLTVVLLNMTFCQKLCRIPDLFRSFAKPLAVSVAAVMGGYGCYCLLSAHLSNGSVAALNGMLAMLLLYLVLSFAFGTITEEDVQALPKGEKIWELLHVAHRFPKKRKNK